MKALQIERSIVRFAAARSASEWRPGAGAWLGPLRLSDVDPPACPAPDWQWSAPAWPGSAAVTWPRSRAARRAASSPSSASLSYPAIRPSADPPTARAVLEPVLHCVTRGIDPLPGRAPPAGPTAASASAATSNRVCKRATAPTGGGWGVAPDAYHAS